jgi:hypothetical protein
MEYGTELWGHRDYPCIRAVQNRAMRYYLKVGKYTPTRAVEGDMGWMPPLIRQQTAQVRYWLKLRNMNENRITNSVFQKQLLDGYVRSWCGRVKKTLQNTNMDYLLTAGTLSKFMIKKYVKLCTENLFQDYKIKWWNELNNDVRRHENQRNKLRQYRLFKTEYKTESYLKSYTNPKYRHAFAQFRTGVAPLNIETARYSTSGYVPVHDRLCILCDTNSIEDEEHVLCQCHAYDDIRNDLYGQIYHVNADFNNYSVHEKFLCMMGSENLCRKVSKACYEILLRRHDCIYKETFNGNDANENINVNNVFISLS